MNHMTHSLCVLIFTLLLLLNLWSPKGSRAVA